MNEQIIIKNLVNFYKKNIIKNIQINSKKCKKKDVFFALEGTRHNGNNFINDAISRGAQVIISNKKIYGKKDHVQYFYSKNPKSILNKTISKLYNNRKLKIVGVTGTNGKSSITNFYFQIFKLFKIKVASIGTLGVNNGKSIKKIQNTTIDPVTLNEQLNSIKKSSIKNLILEASSHGLKQKRLDSIRFNIGIFTNLSRDHLDYHKSYKDYFNSKMILFKKLMKKNSLVIFDNDTNVSGQFKKILIKNKIRFISVGSKQSDVIIKSCKFIKNKQLINFTFKNKEYKFKTSLIGEIQIKNLLLSIIAASQEIPLDKILKKISSIRPVNGRFEPIGSLKNKSRIILDYAHTPDALQTCIKNIKDNFKFSKISIVFGCGGERDKPKRSLMGKVVNKYCEKIYLTDDNPREEDPKKIIDQIKKNIDKNKLHVISNRSLAIKKAIKDLRSGDILIVAGKGHENFQEYKKKYLFSDKLCILKNIEVKNKTLSNNFKYNLINEKIKINNIKKYKKINNASINSKEIKKNNIFFAIKGNKFNGNKFALEAIKKGASLSFVDKIYFKNKQIFKVKNTLNLLTELSKTIRKVSNLKTLGITGSAGKTSLKELIGQCLNTIDSTTFSKKSFNNKFGVPISLFNISNKNVYGVFEIGMDKRGEINKLSKIILPDIGIITNISYAHIKNFKNLKGIAEAKSELIDNIVCGGSIILNKDDKFFNFFYKKAKKRKLNIFSFSKNKKTDAQLIKIVKLKNKSILFVKVFDVKKKFEIKNTNIDYIENILAAILVINILVGESFLTINLFSSFEMPKGRGDQIVIKSKNKKIFIIDESYNSNPLSLKFALKKFENLSIDESKKNILLGDMLELGKFSKKLHKNLAKDINRTKLNKVYVYGKDIINTFDKIQTQKKGKILKNKNEVINLIKNEIRNKDYLIIKGSNATGLNKIVKDAKGGISAL